MRVIVLILWIIISIDRLHGQQELDYLKTLINNYSDIEKYNDVITHSEVLWEKVKNLNDTGIRIGYGIFALSYLLDAHRILNNATEHHTIFLKFNALVLPHLKLAASKYPSFDFTYLYYNFQDALFQRDFGGAMLFLDKAEEKIEEIFKPSDSKYDYRKTQVYYRKGTLFENDQNISLAKYYYEKAFAHGLKFDTEYAKKTGKSWNYSLKPLLSLLKLANGIERFKVLDLILDHFKKLESANSYHKGGNIQHAMHMLMDLTKKGEDSISASVNEGIINFVNKKRKSNKLAQQDIGLTLKIFDYYLSINNIPDALKEKENLESLSKGDISHLLLAEKNLLITKYFVGINEIGQATTTLELCLDNLKLESLGSVWHNPLERNKTLQLLKEIIQLQLDLYDKTKIKNYLLRSTDIAYEVINGLDIFRTNLVEESNRIALLHSLDGIADIALKCFYLSQSQGNIPLDYDKVLAFIELKKSFNLRYKKLLLHQLTNEEKITYLDLDLRINQYVKLPFQDLTAEMQTKLESLRNQQSNLVAEKADQMKVNHSLKNIQELLAFNQLAVDYYVGIDNTYALVFDKKSIHFIALNNQSSRDSLLHQVNAYRYTVTGAHYELTGVKKNKALLEAGHKLYTTLFRPLNSYFNKEILLIPDALFSTIPFNALPTENNNTYDLRKWKFWILENDIQSQPSLYLWADLNSNTQEYKNYTYDITAIAPSFDNLKYNQTEAESVTRYFSKMKLYADSSVRKDVFHQHLSDSRILHLSTHARSDLTNSNNSFIDFKRDSLTADHLEEIEMSSELVFLSACETGIGNVEEAEGVMSLSRAIINAGARSTISTLWSVNDASSKRIVENIYKYLAKGNDKVSAVNKAQREYIAAAKTSDELYPYFWSAYQVLGDITPIKNQQNVVSWLGIFSIFPIISLSFFGWLFFQDKNWMMKISF